MTVARRRARSYPPAVWEAPPEVEPLQVEQAARAKRLATARESRHTGGVVGGDDAPPAVEESAADDPAPAGPVVPNPGEFDPAGHTVPEVVEHLADHPDQTDRVHELESAGKNRVGIVGADGGP